MVNSCVAASCTNKHSDGVSLFKFPQDPYLRKQWVDAVKRTRDKWSGPSHYSVLCSAHFTADCFERSLETFGIKQRRKLKKDAVPSIFKRPREPPCSSEGCSSSLLRGDETGPSKKKKRTGFEKRNRQKIIKEMMMEKSDDETKKLSDGEEENSEDETVSHVKCHEVSTQVDHVLSKSIGIGTLHPLMKDVGVGSGNIRTKTIGTKTDKTKLMDVATETLSVVKVSTAVNTENVRKRNVRLQVHPVIKCIGIQTVSSVCDIGIQCSLITKSEENITSSEEELSQSSHSTTNVHTSTSEYEDSEGDKFTNELSTANILQEPKFIVFETALLSLFQYCSACKLPTSIAKTVIGTYLKITQSCEACHCTRTWKSQPSIGNTPAGNALLSGAILFSGALPTQTIRVLQHINCATITPRTFYHHQKMYLTPTVSYVWLKHQSYLIEELKKSKKPLIIGGDGRADSPGHSAKFGSYSMMDLESMNIIDIQLVQSNEVKSSSHMEIEGLIRAIDLLHDEGLVIKTLVTDRHVQIAKWTRETLPETDHRYDVWHLAKSVRKKLEKISKRKDCEIIAEWMKSIINHLYWCALSTEDGNSAMIEAKWLSIINHIHNIHHGHNYLFPKCAHEHIYRRNKKWLKPHTEASEKLCAAIQANRLCKDISKMSSLHQTSCLEAFHSVIIQFAPKSKCFSYEGMLARLQISAMHYNENKSRDQAKTQSGEHRYSIQFPKYKKGGHIVRKIPVKATFNYVEELFQELLKIVKCNYSVLLPSPPRLAPLCSQYDRLPKPDAISAHQSRFRQK